VAKVFTRRSSELPRRIVLIVGHDGVIIIARQSPVFAKASAS